MTKALAATLVLIAALTGCGSTERPRVATPTPTADDSLAGYSEGVRTYYGGEHLDTGDDPNADVEAQYHQPPKPAEARLGGAITLTGSNIGVRMRVTVTAVHAVRAGGKRLTAVDLTLANTGIAVYDGE